MAGTSFASAIDDPTAPAPIRRSTTNRWAAAASTATAGRSFHSIRSAHASTTPVWELYNLDADPTETTNLAAEHPARVDELVNSFDEAAWDAQVYPLADDFLFFSAVRPPSDDALLQPLRLVPGQTTVDRYRSAKLIQSRSFTVRVDLDFATGDSGILVSHGSLGGGYELTIEDNQFVWTHKRARQLNATSAGGPIPPGTQQLVAEVVAQRGGRWAITLHADDTALAGADGFSAFMGMAPLEGIDIGRSRRSPVSWTRHCGLGSFAYRGTLRSVTYIPGDLAPDAPEFLVHERKLRQTTFD